MINIPWHNQTKCNFVYPSTIWPRKWSNPFAIINQTGAGSIWQPIFLKAWIYRTTKYMSRLTNTFWGDYYVVLSTIIRSTNVGVSLVKDAFRQRKDQCRRIGLGLHDVIVRTFLTIMQYSVFLDLLYFPEYIVVHVGWTKG